MNIDNARNKAIATQRPNFVTAALAAALSGLSSAVPIESLGRMRPFENLGRFPTLGEFTRHMGGSDGPTCRDDLEAMFGPLQRPTPRPGASTSLRYDQRQRRNKRRRGSARAARKAAIGKLFHAEYIGDDSRYRDATALICFDRFGNWFAQFDDMNRFPRLSHGWHSIVRREWRVPRREWRIPRRHASGKTVRVFGRTDEEGNFWRVPGIEGQERPE